jgi:hypothetical protein
LTACICGWVASVRPRGNKFADDCVNGELYVFPITVNVLCCVSAKPTPKMDPLMVRPSAKPCLRLTPFRFSIGTWFLCALRFQKANFRVVIPFGYGDVNNLFT